jgi:hypothetical protein
MLSVPKLTRRLLRVESSAVVDPTMSYYSRSLETGMLKVAAAVALVRDLRAFAEPVLVVGVNEQALARVAHSLARGGEDRVERLSPVYSSGAARLRAAQQFQTGATKVLIAPARLLLGLSPEKVCRHVVFVELDPTTGVHLHAEARVVRAGSRWPHVFSHILVSDSDTDHEALASMGATWLNYMDPALGLRPVQRAA